MEAKDTVQHKCICGGYDFEPFYSPWDTEHKKPKHCYECDAYNEGKRHQAEISFKAGRNSILEEVSERLNVIDQRQGVLKKKFSNIELALKEAYEAGIKEVVEFIPLQEYLNQSTLIEDVPIWIGLNRKETQAKLKEWGIT